MKETGKSLLMKGWISNFILYWFMFNGKWKYEIKSSKKSPISSALSTEKFFFSNAHFLKLLLPVHSHRFSSSKLSNQKNVHFALVTRKLSQRNVLQQNANCLWRKSVSALES